MVDCCQRNEDAKLSVEDMQRMLTPYFKQDTESQAVTWNIFRYPNVWQYQQTDKCSLRRKRLPFK